MSKYLILIELDDPSGYFDNTGEVLEEMKPLLDDSYDMSHRDDGRTVVTLNLTKVLPLPPLGEDGEDVGEPEVEPPPEVLAEAVRRRLLRRVEDREQMEERVVELLRQARREGRI